MYLLHGEPSPAAISVNVNTVLIASEDEIYRQAHWVNAYIMFFSYILGMFFVSRSQPSRCFACYF